MADLKVNIIATDKATPSINKVGQAVTSLATQLGGLSGGIGKLANQLGGLIGAGGMAGVAIGAVTLAANIEDLKADFADWATGMGYAGEALGELDQKTKTYIDTLKSLRNELELVKQAGVARAAIEFGQAQREVSELDQKLQARQRDIALLEALRQEQAKGIGVPGVGFIFPGLKDTEQLLKKAKEDAAGLAKQLGAAQTQLSIAAKSLTGEQAEEAKKKFKELEEAGKKAAEEISKAQIRGLHEWYEQLSDLMKEEQIERDTEFRWAEERLELGTKIREQTQKLIDDEKELNKEIAKRGRLETLTFYDDEVKAGLRRNEKLAKDIIDKSEEVRKEQERQYEKMIDNIRDGVGDLFDAMLIKGQSVFSSLANFAQGVLQTMLRNIFQNAMTAIISSNAAFMRIIGGGTLGGGGGGGAAAMTGGGMAAMGGFGGLANIFKRGAKPGNLRVIGTDAMGLPVFAKATSFATSAAGSALTGGGALVGSMLATDAFRRGSAIEGLAGGAMAGASIGTMIAPGIGTAIGAGVGAIAGLVTGLFGGGAKRRAEEAAKRAAAQETQKFGAPETITRFGIAGGAGYSVETDLTGGIRGIGVTPTVIVNVQNNMIDARHAREAGQVIGQEVSRQILQGGSYLGDNIAWAAS